MGNIKKRISEWLQRLIIEKQTGFKEVEYLHPSGYPIPKGDDAQRAEYIKASEVNKENFQSEGVENGGIITFSTDYSSHWISEEVFKKEVEGIMDSFLARMEKSGIQEPQFGAFSVGHFFQGHYTGMKNCDFYYEESWSILVNGLTGKQLLDLAMWFLEGIGPEGLLVKDLKTGKIYTANCI